MKQQIFRNGLLHITLSAVIGGAVIGWLSMAQFRLSSASNQSAPAVVLEPSQVDIDGVVEGDIVAATFALRNTTAHPIKVASCTSSCGCLLITGKNEEPLSLPFDMEPGEQVPIHVSVDTGGKEGHDSQQIAIQSIADGNIEATTGTINLFICPGLRNFTGPVVFDRVDASSRAKVFVGDGCPDPGVEIESISSSAPGLVGAEFQALERYKEIAHVDDGPGRTYTVKERYCIDLELKDRSKTFSERILLQPKASNRKPLYISVFYRGETFRRELFPAEVVFDRSAGGVLTREIRFVPRVPLEQDRLPLKISHAPPHVETAITSYQGYWTVVATLVGAQESFQEGPIVIVDSQDKAVARVPVVVVGNDTGDGVFN